MARNIFPLFGPSVPMMSISLGFFDGSNLTVPRSGFLPTVTVYLPSPMTSLMVFRTSSGNFSPLSSAADGSQVPSIDLSSSLASSPRERHGNDRVRNKMAHSERVMVRLLVSRGANRIGSSS